MVLTATPGSSALNDNTSSGTVSAAVNAKNNSAAKKTATDNLVSTKTTTQLGMDAGALALALATIPSGTVATARAAAAQLNASVISRANLLAGQSIANNSSTAAASGTYPTVSNSSAIVNLGPNVEVFNDKLNGYIKTSLPLFVPQLSINGKTFMDNAGNMQLDGVITGTQFTVVNSTSGSIAHSVTTNGDMMTNNSLLVGSLGATVGLPGNYVLSDGSPYNPGFSVDAFGNVTANGALLVNNDIITQGNLFSKTTYAEYSSNVYEASAPNMVVNKAILDQVVQNITGGDSASINALKDLIDAYNSQDLSVIQTILNYQNSINNNLLKQIDRLYTYFFRNVSSVVTDASIFGTPDNTYYTQGATTGVNAANLTKVSGNIVFTEPNPYIVPSVTITGSINTGTDSGAIGLLGAGAGAIGSGGPNTVESVTVNSSIPITTNVNGVVATAGTNSTTANTTIGTAH